MLRVIKYSLPGDDYVNMHHPLENSAVYFMRPSLGTPTLFPVNILEQFILLKKFRNFLIAFISPAMIMPSHPSFLSSI